MTSQSQAPIALVTGGTDGIGRATALGLAEQGYSVHILGRNNSRGEATLNELTGRHRDGSHEFFRVDLADNGAVLDFLDTYPKSTDQLDLLFLNALAVNRKGSTSPAGVDLTAAVGVLSRYLFSLRLNHLLNNTPESRVIHNGNAKRHARVNYDKLLGGQLGALRSTVVTYSLQAQLAMGMNSFGITDVPHMMVMPGVVATSQLGPMARLPKPLLRLVGVRQAHDVGDVISSHVAGLPASGVASAYYVLDRHTPAHESFLTDDEAFTTMTTWCEQHTGISLDDITID